MKRGAGGGVLCFSCALFAGESFSTPCPDGRSDGAPLNERAFYDGPAR